MLRSDPNAIFVITDTDNINNKPKADQINRFIVKRLSRQLAIVLFSIHIFLQMFENHLT